MGLIVLGPEKRLFPLLSEFSLSMISLLLSGLYILGNTLLLGAPVGWHRKTKNTLCIWLVRRRWDEKVKEREECKVVPSTPNWRSQSIRGSWNQCRGSILRKNRKYQNVSHIVNDSIVLWNCSCVWLYICMYGSQWKIYFLL